MASDQKSSELAEQAKASLGDAFGGAWIDQASGKLTVAVTRPGLSVSGADVKVVSSSLAQLNGTKSVLDLMSAPSSITSWRVDEKSNTVVVEVNKNTRDAAAEKFIATAKSIGSAVTVEEVTESPKPLYDLRGGDAIYMGGGRCSLGFSVSGGYVTAGHCGTTGTAVSGYNRVAQGTFAGSVFPSSDMAWVRTNANWTPRPWVNRYNGSNVTVQGSTQAAVGSQICRSGSTTGWRCGTVQAFNQTVNYPQGQVRGLTRTNACAEGGDSGGSWVAGSGFGQAQGVTSGGSGNCSSGGTTYFQPLNPILSRWGLTLTRG
ncbi:S1 family peptidase [Lentzea xinjiangensis]|uniref:S1 family peptidase n=1 Tax=Lentzea xinjiangensis TaxID=402600 RepID=UPI00318342C9